MAFRRALVFGLCLTAAACGTNLGGNVGLNGDCVSNDDCREPYVCRGGTQKKCTIDPPKICSPATTRCVGDFVQTCNELGSAWLDDAPACVTGCGMIPGDGGTLKAGCKAEFCRPNSSRCEGPNVIVKCDAAGTSEFFYRSCASGCVAEGTEASCAAQRCRPYETSCKTGDPSKLLTCDSRGVQRVESDCPNVGTQASTCVAGRCIAQVCTTTTTGGTTTRQQRCNGAIREECNDAGTGWRSVEVCALGCDFDSQTNAASCAEPSCKVTPTDEPLGAFASVCDPADPTRVQLLTCDERGADWIRTDCSALPSPHVCVSGACVPKVCSVQRDGTGAITSRQQRCTGAQIEECDDSQARFRPVGDACQFGCNVNASGAAQCAAPECSYNGGGTAAQTTCAGNTLERCNSTGVFAFERFCPSGCVVGANGIAACAALVCTPLARDCRTDTTGAFVRICKSDGTGHEVLERCPQGCETNRCTVTDDTCSPGALRCAANSVQKCVSLPNGATEWRFTETCLDGCVAGVCTTTAACGCTGPAEPPEVECGAATRAPFSMSVVKDADDTNLPCDGASTFLVLTSQITSSTGTVVPDGTMVTFTPAGSAAAAVIISSADADATRPGIQRPTRNGVARVVVASPETCTAPVTQELRATVGTDCGAALSLSFATLVDTGDGIPAYVAEDFSSWRNRNSVLTEADWSTDAGLLTGRPIFWTGTGADGDLLVGTGAAGTGNSVFDLADRGYARSVDVVRVGTNDVTTPTNLPPFAPGDEVLLFTQWSTSADDVGNFEFKRVAAVATGRVIFTEPITNAYAPTDDLAGRRVMLLRVPHFRNVTIQGNGELTTAGPVIVSGGVGLGGGAGILAFRATGTVVVQGLINMDGKGLPDGFGHGGGAQANQTLPRLIIGGSGGGLSAGGGGVYIAAAKISHLLTATAPPPAPEGTIRARSTSGFGGIIWTSSGQLMVGATPRATLPLHVATGGTAPRAGVIRSDYIGTDAETVHWASPSPYRVQSGGFSVTSTIVRTTPDNDIEEVKLVGGFAGNGYNSRATSPGLQVLLDPANPPVQLPGALVDVSATQGTVWQPGVENGADLTTTGANKRAFMWRVKLNPVSGEPLEVGGLGFRLLLR